MLSIFEHNNPVHVPFALVTVDLTNEIYIIEPRKAFRDRLFDVDFHQGTPLYSFPLLSFFPPLGHLQVGNYDVLACVKQHKARIRQKIH